MQNVLNHWEGALHTTGGAIAADKSYWHLIDFKWTQGDWKYRRIDEVPGELTVTGTDGNPVTIDRLEINESKELLGLQLRPDGDCSDQVKRLRKKTIQWAENIRTGHVDADDAWYCLINTILKTVEYPLMATTMTKEELTHVIAPMLEAGLPRSGIQKKLARVLVHGPLDVQGLGIPHPHTTQLIQHIQAILRHGTRPTLTGHLLRCNMESLQLELGTEKPF
jgi:hypothetical protein